jgi:anaerobic ribonucleoside-triphosphate reductase activating protein
MRIASYDIVFQDVPEEVTLSLNLSQCPNRCPGCHSPQLQDDIGFPLDDGLLDGLLERYGNDVTCVCFMGGDREPAEVMRLAGHVHSRGLKTAWYSGKQRLPDCFRTDVLDYVKVGPYIESKGPLPSPDTNQRMYKVENGELTDITMSFRKKGVG